ncbi:MAG: phosphate starvation-inducible protein PhoH [Candidatus Lloydbacteria bacterium RIFCSPHIGHO2_01_FULL_49_22]|uniref:Phosphate starvation-inducible protein PhoH n=1 Tax=Candidatus Lloydbacteria bacterium RIFCSPHIGHO2_01_FULL_49_22 TaxID=1798658 RepID=A0A1G2CV54_9BACT|nr:MAG: phosphate starvation-inducible protein PhoH [Candidatus Lloydbacteria bacterium RIFCSPHIGHO2_01_FULL_49_22]OGZ10254.1 MAG: phosphate starvation-inducible protein PhoH [Candidatus Lloydbacteria bacterium RIFCSPHIGHO2_02_FULL_50_18]
MTEEKSKATKRTAAPKRTALKQTSLFVLDTNVLMHDPSALFRFEEHDVYLPMIILQELDRHKRGLTEEARNVRRVMRDLDALSSKIAKHNSATMSKGFPLNSTGHLDATGKLFFQTDLADVKLPKGLPDGEADNQILGVVQALCEREPDRHVVLVSNDINMRVKARALGLPVEDYKNDKVLQDIDLLHTGALELPKNFWNTTEVEWSQKGRECAITGKICEKMLVHQFVYHESGDQPFYAIVTETSDDTATLRVLTDYGSKEHAVMGILARNREQNFAFNLLMDPDVDFVSLVGIAGTGKTLLALAAGLAGKNDIIMTRATVSVGEDIGFLPGTEEEKMGPWMGALTDNMEVLNSNPETLLKMHSAKASGVATDVRANKSLSDRVKIKSMNFMRGRTFLNKYVIIDEAQNLTPKQAKTLITRAGPGTKIVFLGNLAQIDTPYLTEGSSGLTYVVDRFKGWPFGGHITLPDCERSRLAAFAEQVL